VARSRPAAVAAKYTVPSHIERILSAPDFKTLPKSIQNLVTTELKKRNPKASESADHASNLATAISARGQPKAKTLTERDIVDEFWKDSKKRSELLSKDPEWAKGLVESLPESQKVFAELDDLGRQQSDLTLERPSAQDAKRAQQQIKDNEKRLAELNRQYEKAQGREFALERLGQSKQGFVVQGERQAANYFTKAIQDERDKLKKQIYDEKKVAEDMVDQLDRQANIRKWHEFRQKWKTGTDVSDGWNKDDFSLGQVLPSNIEALQNIGERKFVDFLDAQTRAAGGKDVPSDNIFTPDAKTVFLKQNAKTPGAPSFITAIETEGLTNAQKDATKQNINDFWSFFGRQLEDEKNAARYASVPPEKLVNFVNNEFKQQDENKSISGQLPKLAAPVLARALQVKLADELRRQAERGDLADAMKLRDVADAEFQRIAKTKRVPLTVPGTQGSVFAPLQDPQFIPDQSKRYADTFARERIRSTPDELKDVIQLVRTAYDLPGFQILDKPALVGNEWQTCVPWPGCKPAMQKWLDTHPIFEKVGERELADQARLDDVKTRIQEETMKNLRDTRHLYENDQKNSRQVLESVAESYEWDPDWRQGVYGADPKRFFTDLGIFDQPKVETKAETKKPVFEIVAEPDAPETIPEEGEIETKQPQAVPVQSVGIGTGEQTGQEIVVGENAPPPPPLPFRARVVPWSSFGASYGSSVPSRVANHKRKARDLSMYMNSGDIRPTKRSRMSNTYTMPRTFLMNDDMV
jgi:hypothetical protein